MTGKELIRYCLKTKCENCERKEMCDEFCTRFSKKPFEFAEANSLLIRGKMMAVHFKEENK